MAKSKIAEESAPARKPSKGPKPSLVAGAELLPTLEAIHRIDQILAAARNSPAEDRLMLRIRKGLLAELDGILEARLAPNEPALWALLEPTAKAAVEFWATFFDMRCGAKNDTVLGYAEKARFTCIVRAVSWTETRHGTNTDNYGDVDPMQMGNPADAWWQSLTKQASAFERFIGGPNGPNYWSWELPAKAKSAIPKTADVSVIDKKLGHSDPAFTSDMSFYFGVPYLLIRINKDKFYKCGLLKTYDLFEGAVDYNGNPDVEADYRKRLQENLDSTGCL